MKKIARWLGSLVVLALALAPVAFGKTDNVVGTVTAIGQQDFTVKTTDGREIKVAFDGVTSFEGMGGPCSSNELTLGERVVVHTVHRQDGAAPKATFVKLGSTTFAAKDQSSSAKGALSVSVTDHGFTPNRLSAKKGEPLTLVITRTSDRTCATAIKIPDYGIEKALPLNEPVTVTFVPKQSGEVKFTCGMGMLGGVIVVE